MSIIRVQNKELIGKMENNYGIRVAGRVINIASFTLIKNSVIDTIRSAVGGSLRCSYFMNGPRQGFTCGTALLTYSS